MAKKILMTTHLNFFSMTKNSWFGCGDFDNEAFTFE
jgi:hypothetical protein